MSRPLCWQPVLHLVGRRHREQGLLRGMTVRAQLVPIRSLEEASVFTSVVAFGLSCRHTICPPFESNYQSLSVPRRFGTWTGAITSWVAKAAWPYGVGNWLASWCGMGRLCHMSPCERPICILWLAAGVLRYEVRWLWAKLPSASTWPAHLYAAATAIATAWMLSKYCSVPGISTLS